MEFQIALSSFFARREFLRRVRRFLYWTAWVVTGIVFALELAAYWFHSYIALH
jgi:hypothetical protein